MSEARPDGGFLNGVCSASRRAVDASVDHVAPKYFIDDAHVTRGVSIQQLPHLLERHLGLECRHEDRPIMGDEALTRAERFPWISGFLQRAPDDRDEVEGAQAQVLVQIVSMDD